MSRSELNRPIPVRPEILPPLPPGEGRGEGCAASAGDEALTFTRSQSRERRPERIPPGVDWRGWIALAWVIPFALLYVRMILEQRAPSLLHAIKALGLWSFAR